MMLGKLGSWLRIFGQDTGIVSDKLDDREILEKAKREDRVVLTRDKDLKKINSSVEVFLIRSKDFEDQIRKVFNKFDIEPGFPESSRCSHCNGELKSVGKDEWICKNCSHEYWKGSHWKRIKKLQRELKNL